MAAVGGCCLCVYGWSVIGLQCVIHFGSKNYPMIHSFSNCSLWSIPWVLSFWHALQLFKTSILQTLLAISNPTHFVTNCKYGHFIFLTFSILYHGRVAKHLNFSCGLYLCNFHLSFSKTTACLLQATSLGTFASMHNFVQRNGTPSIFYQVFSSLFLWYFSSYTIRQNHLQQA
jgi:hypothetical protein